ncbi:MAG TPA: DmsC/YnfH family molybdoenzyme membrane anchor subunit, partial [Pirellulaceae bacterium]|nr:DmsC/YnfH family molybdoenzyme membrane anchor subunit [Pirellulaceae bacterium]
AIRITIVSKQQVIEDSEANLFLVGAPEPGYTLPTTIYKSEKPLPRNLLPADYFAARPQHAHWPLIWMLVLTQLSVGGFCVEQLLASGWLPVESSLLAATRPMHIVVALALGLLGLQASIFHLGRPFYAFRAVLGLRTSWLSREILGFGLFAAAATTYTVSAWLATQGFTIRESWQHGLGLATALIGVASVFCSVMIYVDTRRDFWTFGATLRKFLLTGVILGLPIAVLSALVSAQWVESLPTQAVLAQIARPLWQLLIAATTIKLFAEATIFVSLQQARHTPLKRTATLMAGELARATFGRFVLGSVGGILLPLLFISLSESATTREPSAGVFALLTMLSLAMLFAGEVLERYLFFAAVVAPKMPGSPAS